MSHSITLLLSNLKFINIKYQVAVRADIKRDTLKQFRMHAGSPSATLAQHQPSFNLSMGGDPMVTQMWNIIYGLWHEKWSNSIKLCYGCNYCKYIHQIQTKTDWKWTWAYIRAKCHFLASLNQQKKVKITYKSPKMVKNALLRVSINFFYFFYIIAI